MRILRLASALVVCVCAACGSDDGGSTSNVDTGKLVKTREAALAVQDACNCTPPEVPACGASDIADKDYDGDAKPNCQDDDIDGDGLLNADDCVPLVSFEAMVDCSLGDLATKDDDGDGTRNCEDADIDDDGAPNVCDGDPYDDK